MAASHADIVEAAELTEQWGPDDPQTHYAVAVLRERGFLPDDIARSLDEYSRATALSPNNYLCWLSLGNARARDGDLFGAEKALRTAEQLAGLRLRPMVCRECTSPPEWMKRSKVFGRRPLRIHNTLPPDKWQWQYFDGDVDRIRESVGDSPEITGR